MTAAETTKLFVSSSARNLRRTQTSFFSVTWNKLHGSFMVKNTSNVHVSSVVLLHCPEITLKHGGFANACLL